MFFYIYTPATMHTHAHTRKRARACVCIVQVCKWTLLAEMRLAHYPAPLLWLLPHQVRFCHFANLGRERRNFWRQKFTSCKVDR